MQKKKLGGFNVSLLGSPAARGHLRRRQYALDTDWHALSQLATILDDCLRDWGAELNKLKTQWMEIPSLSSPPGQLWHLPLPQPTRRPCLAPRPCLQAGLLFLRLGGEEQIYRLHSGTSLDVGRSIGQAEAAFGQLVQVRRSRQM